MNQGSIKNRSIFKLTSTEEFFQMLDKHGEEFAKFSNWVFEWMSSIPANFKWFEYEVAKGYVKPFIKVACLFMILKNSLSEYWEFNEDYTKIRHYQDEKKQDNRGCRTR